jgi:two-component system sensor histidine kinase CreC
LPYTGERFLLRQALANLLQNAIEFTPSGGSIAIRAATGPGGIELAIADTGAGIPEYALPRVFDRFYSLPRPDTGQKSSGLGLSLVREAVRLHGGEVRLAHNPGGGVCATIRLPCVPSST